MYQPFDSFLIGIENLLKPLKAMLITFETDTRAK